LIVRKLHDINANEALIEMPNNSKCWSAAARHTREYQDILPTQFGIPCPIMLLHHLDGELFAIGL
jgi:hypothetical protein